MPAGLRYSLGPLPLDLLLANTGLQHREIERESFELIESRYPV